MRTLQLTLHEAIEITKALANENRMEIIKELTGGPKNVNEISAALNIPFSTAAASISKLEESGLINTEIVPGRGNQKVSSKRYDRIIIDLEEKIHSTEDMITFELEIGDYVHCEIEPTCGLLSDKGIIHTLDDPRSFFEPERKRAQLIWFRSGFIEYHFPNRIPYGTTVEELSFSVELCSEAPYHNENWPSDISCWINGAEIGFWTSPGDFGGERGFLTPNWWETHNTQFGVLKYWTINKEGSFIDGVKISPLTIDDLKLQELPYISLRLGVKKDAYNPGGMNIFGSQFGNYEQGIIMKINYTKTV
ncbi:ArsR/SmtB family transcription factor [Sporosarcina sp. G11-34]|uniref:ArsR/SmtB family transcription factor n=1 Tax=Sporosarcina sp. G11-34 TaxID=2849605 RepID=UPI0022A9A50F|nr:ArsR family transcriptional regulator [Sporosarcina sp. G11-34]MCZ2258584.1 helix-turn-helix domain-containing protein [Sporosarcina sp. G11-34]